MANQMLIIFPYKYEDTWVFDDDRVGLVREPFVAGIPAMIEKIVQDTPTPERGFKLLFSAQPFPGYQIELIWNREEYGGNWYSWQSQNLEGWLCPALFLYFEQAPPRIYCKAEPKYK